MLCAAKSPRRAWEDATERRRMGCTMLCVFRVGVFFNKPLNQEPVTAFQLLPNRQCSSEEKEDEWMPGWNLSGGPYDLAKSFPCDSAYHPLQRPERLCASLCCISKNPNASKTGWHTLFLPMSVEMTLK